jgi:hypothetical protein
MAVMEFLRQNLLNTTTMITTTANNGVGTFAYAYDRNVRLKYTTVGYNSSTVSGFSVKFSSTTPVSHILIQNHNLRQFRVYYDSVTANSLAVVTNNSATSTYISFATVSVANIEIEMELQQTSGAPASNTEKMFGEIIIGDRLLVFERNPSYDNWNPTWMRKQIVHEMPDGGVKVFQIQDKFQANLQWHYVTQSFRDNLYTLWSSANSMYFVPFPTTSAWDGRAYEIAWLGDFNFTYEENSKTQGFMGNVMLRETAGG